MLRHCHCHCHPYHRKACHCNKPGDTPISFDPDDTLSNISNGIQTCLDGREAASTGIAAERTADEFQPAANAISAAADFRTYGTRTAQDDTDFILYNTATGALLYDADGNGAGVAAIEFATLSGHPTIAADNFFTFSS
jgi:Ca2+-binding RTX toxin-like protein